MSLQTCSVKKPRHPRFFEEFLIRAKHSEMESVYLGLRRFALQTVFIRDGECF